jgi:mannose-6-phosphate isomerase-like protein (cupin superfamily)
MLNKRKLMTTIIDEGTDISRKITNLNRSAFIPYDLDGPVQKDMHLLNLSYDPISATGWYVIRMDPGATTVPHEHKKLEEFLILEGELIESDGTVLTAGDFVSYAPGTSHNSRTDTGCLFIGLDRTPE